MKRFLRHLLMFVVIIAAYIILNPTKAQAASTSDLTFEFYWYGESNGCYNVTRCNTSASGDLVIPATYNGKPVGGISYDAFYGCTELTSVTIPDSVTTIGGYAFGGCSKLTSVTIGSGVKTIGDSAFYGCYSLTGIWVDEDNPKYRSDSLGFVFNKDKTELVFAPRTITSYTIPNNVTRIGADAFAYCERLTDVTIGNSLTYIGDEAFYGCDNLQNVHITDVAAWCKIHFDWSSSSGGCIYTNPLYYAENLYLNGELVTELVIPRSITSIGPHTFENYDKLTSVTIHDGVTAIGASAFIDCDALTDVTLGKGITSIGGDAFKRCNNLENVYISDLAAWYNASANGFDLFDMEPFNILYYADNLYLNGELVTELVIPETVTSLSNCAFQYYKKLTSVTIPDHVTSIGGSEFLGCIGLSNITIGNGITEIGRSAFSGCYNLKSILMSNSITTVDFDAFRNCTNLKTVYFKGTPEDWEWILFRSGNDYLKNAEVIFNYPGDVNPEQNHNVEILPYKASTCVETGLTEGLWCADCGEIFITPTVIPATGDHIEEVIPSVPACTGNGLTEGKKCALCDEILVAQKALPLAEHTIIIVSAVTPTCTTAGISECQHCVICQTVLSELEVIPPVGHTELIIPGRAPTCAEYGLSEGRQCAVCGEILVEQYQIDKLPHTAEILTGYDATCTEDGLTEGVMCSICGEILTEQYVISALGHKEVPVAAKEATCSTNGNTEASFCYVCRKLTVMPQVIPALGHAEVVTAGKAATCTENGLTNGKYCFTCGETLVEQAVIPAWGHTEKTIDGKAATCTETGLTDGKECAVCGKVLVPQEVIPATGHTEKVVPGHAPSCTATGLTEGKKCAICGEVLAAQETILSLGHIYSDFYDSDCDTCGEARVGGVLEFVNYRVVFTDKDDTHGNHRAVIYKLGDQTVADPANENALKAIDPNAVTMWGARDINKILITDAGNYVVLLKYNVGTGAAVKVPLVLNVSADPKLIIDKNNKITAIDNNEANINHRVVVYYLGDQTVEDIYDVTALEAIDSEPETIWKIKYINRLALTKGGNYVLHLCYNEGVSSKITVAQQFTVYSIPTLSVDVNNKLVATEENAENRNHRVTVFYLGENEVEDSFDEEEVKAAAVTSNTYWGLDAINKVELKVGGNYVIHLYYNVGTSEKRTLALDIILNERPVLSVDENGKISVSYTDPEINNPRAYIYKVDDAEIADIYDEAALKKIATPTQVWGLSSINKKTLTPGNYVIHLYYSVGSSAKKTVALKITI